MAASLKLYTDPALANELIGNITISQNTDGSTGDVDGVIYLGSVETSKTFQAASDPGADQITVSIVDSNVSPGLTPEATDIKLATSNAGLDAAVAGDPLNIGTTLISGVGNQVAIHYRVITPTAASGSYTELSLSTNPIHQK